MKEHLLNTVYQDTTTGVKENGKKKNADSISKKHKDTVHFKSDTLIKKDTTTKDSNAIVADKIHFHTKDTLNTIPQTPVFTKHMELIPLKTTYFSKDVPAYKPFDITTATTQKYPVVKIENNYFNGEKFFRPATDWMVIVGIVSLFVLGWVYGFFKKYLAQLFQSAYDDKVSYKLMQERSSITERVSFALNILFVLNFGLFIYEVLTTFKISVFGLHNFSLFALLTGIITIIYLFKYILYSFIGYVFHASREISEIIHSIFLYSKIFGIFLIPILIFIPFVDESQAKYFAFAGIILFAISFLFRIFRGFLISLKINFSIFYLILYLCAFEILPLLIIGKFFYKLINS